MQLYVVRHGQTVWNAEGKLQGRTDIELNQNGIDAAVALGRQLAGTRFDKIFSSPLKRAVHTAQLIRQGICEGQGVAPESLEIQTDPRLIEMSFGVGEGCSCDEWFADSSPYRFFFTEPQKFPKPPQGESFEDVMARTKSFAQEIIEPLYQKADRLMIVAHGALNKGLMCYLQNHGVEDYWLNGLQENCQASVFEYDGKVWRTIKG
ncbi:MAG: histidine phosphatase family protein [Treponema sp.]|nr:histidine phosphatase family protein [Treponema sp.]